jgi:hypothetical protein
MNVAIFDVELPELICAGNFQIAGELFDALNFFLLLKQEILLLAKVINFFMIHSHLILKFKAFMQGPTA